MGSEATRRELVRSAFAAGAAILVVASASDALASAPAETEARALERALEIEQLVVIAYRQVLATDLLRTNVRNQLQVALGQELEHVEVLERALATLGQPPAPASPGIAAAQSALGRHHIHRSLSDFRNQHDCLRLLIDVESLAEGAYFAAIGKLTDPALVRTSAEIMGCEAQHWSVLSGLQHHGDVTQSVPYPFVQGST
jgi:hypothetical protein